MKKRSNSGLNIRQIMSVFALVLGILPLALAGLKVVSYNVLITTVEVSGFDAAFGNDNLDPNFGVMLAYLLPLAGGILALLSNVMGKGNRLFNILSLAAFVVSAIMLFMIPQFMAWNIGDSLTFEPKMLNGVIFAAIPTILGGLTQVFLLATND
ncbi:hypothetical protein [Acholeplasma hippikon]|uniref:Uncharacterized protein n=1 Tax=Acholeplasma hippikon TaxID=264636 RepID=A0A449BJY1_9MOLU|nr:hypothetical protein [Acholeplasma hippikon]VEU82781.1 Uncharacterised protein [Acholeplasma hippikon]